MDKVIDNVVKIHKNTPDPHRPSGIFHEDLQALAVNPDLEHYQIVCHWKGLRSSSGWSQGIPLSNLAMGSLVMQEAVTKLVKERTVK